MTTQETQSPPVPVCRWRLDCAEPGRNIVDVASLKRKVPACDSDAQWHADWAKRRADREAAGQVSLMPDPEPEPECYCPDKARKWSAQRRREEVPYCPLHGTEQERGVAL